MTYRKLLVSLTTETNAERLTQAACFLARKFDAHIIGLHTKQSMHVHPGVAVHLTPEAIKMFPDAQNRQAETIRAIFERVTGAEGIAGNGSSSTRMPTVPLSVMSNMPATPI